MSAQHLQKIVGRAVIEAGYRALLFSDPDQALAGYELTDQEIRVLKQGLSSQKFDTLASQLEPRISKAMVCGRTCCGHR